MPTNAIGELFPGRGEQDINGPAVSIVRGPMEEPRVVGPAAVSVPLGATGSAGQIAVQTAKLLGANKIIAAGRNKDRLADLSSLGATDTVLMDGASGSGDLSRQASDVDVVIDDLWGETTAAAMLVVVSNRTDPGRLLSWIEIGSVAGPTAAIPSAALRAARLQIVGSGQGSVSTRTS